LARVRRPTRLSARLSSGALSNKWLAMLMLSAHLGAIHEIETGRVVRPSDAAGSIASRAARLRREGVGRNSIVLIAHGGSADFFLDLFAVWACGAAAACLDPDLTPPEVENVAAFCRPAVILTHRGRPSPLPALPGVVDLTEADSARDAPEPVGDLDDPALLLFTSGTTGAPKAVTLSFRAILARIALNANAIGRDALQRTLVTLPTHFGHGLIGNALTPLMHGADILLPKRGIELALRLGEILDAHRITFLSSVPSFWRLALRATPPALGSLKRVHVGSAPLSAELWRKMAAWAQCDVVNCYGITETANWIGGASSKDGFEDGLVGAPWGGHAAVRAEDGAISAHGEGEILVQTPALMSGYFQRQGLTETALIGGWYRTGDIGTVRPDGAIRLSGRTRDEINRAGMKIQPADVDMVLERHPAVEEACAFGLPDAVAGEIVAVALRLKDGASASEREIRAWCGERMRPSAIPEKWFFVGEIPRTSRGKVSRDAVRNTLTGKAAP
jgi:oxalate---CoA ligase